MFTYIPKKSKDIYNIIIAHRGYHYIYPENTIASYKEAIKRNMAIELDIRITKDGYIVCIHDRYAKRLLGIKGRIAHMCLSQVEECNVCNTLQKVPLLNEVLNVISGKIPLLIEVKGLLTYEFENKLLYLILNYDGIVYFHTENLISYYRLKNIWGDKVFFILNPFRKRFMFLKNRYYKKLRKQNYHLYLT